MRKFLAAAVLIMALSVTTFAGYIDQTGAPCNPNAQSNCIYINDGGGTSSTDPGTGGVIDTIVAVLSALFAQLQA